MQLALSVGIVHVLLGAGVVGAIYKGLEQSVAIAAAAGISAAGIVISGDLLIGEHLVTVLTSITWVSIKRTVIAAAFGSAVGIVGFAVTFQPDVSNNPQAEERD